MGPVWRMDQRQIWQAKKKQTNTVQRILKQKKKEENTMKHIEIMRKIGEEVGLNEEIIIQAIIGNLKDNKILL